MLKITRRKPLKPPTKSQLVALRYVGDGVRPCPDNRAEYGLFIQRGVWAKCHQNNWLKPAFGNAGSMLTAEGRAVLRQYDGTM